jgi:diguanylate cyclase (GGDEF)-like protein
VLDFESVFQALPTAYLALDRDLVIVAVNDAYLGMVGRTSAELLGRPVFVAFPPAAATLDAQGRSPLQRSFESVRDSGRPDSLPLLHYDVLDSDGRHVEERFWSTTQVALADDDDTTRLIIQRVEEVTEAVRESLHDPLTGMANRTLLLLMLEHAVARLQNRPGLLAVLFVDLDRFRLVNESLGREAGDDLLVLAADRITRALPVPGVTARLGGDEFVVVCEDLTGPTDAEVVADRVLKALQPPMLVRDREVYVGASVGVVTGDGGRPAPELLVAAEAAMSRAKQAGGGHYSLGDPAGVAPGLDGPADRLELTGDLHHAVSRGELRAAFQPIVDLATGELTAAEALLRWRHPRHGLLQPAAFLGVAGDVGLLQDFDAWIMANACTEAAGWAARLGRPVGIYVNLSRRSLADPGLARTVESALTGAGLDARLLTLEITEDALMQDAESTVRTLRGLRDLGVQLTIDDFGTGYSSLAYLQQFPVHSLKVDRSFVSRLDQDGQAGSDSAAIVQAIVQLADGLGLRSVAEGIETPAQLTLVTDLGCDLGQGYLLGRPEPTAVLLREAGKGLLTPPGVPRQRPAQSAPTLSEGH